MLKFNFLFFLIFLVLLTFPFVSAEVVPQNYQQLVTGMELKISQDNILTVYQDYDFYVHPYDIATGNAITSKTDCTFWLYNQTGSNIYNHTNNFVIGAAGDNFHFFVKGENFSTAGDYYYNVECADDAIGGFASSILTVLPAQEDNTTFFIIFLMLAFALLIIAFIFKNTVFAFISGLAFLSTGVYTMVYGFGSFTNPYTQIISYIIIGLGTILSITSAYDLIEGGESETLSIEE
jgi:hypothetical protein